jgi:predicted RNA-binding Zn-ribbon protein involved in translation (DUF1610 family)
MHSVVMACRLFENPTPCIFIGSLLTVPPAIFEQVPFGTGNVHDAEGGSTYCPHCGTRVIERDWYELGAWQLTETGACKSCGTQIPGVFAGPNGVRSIVRCNYKRRDWPRKEQTLLFRCCPSLFAAPHTPRRDTLRQAAQDEA